MATVTEAIVANYRELPCVAIILSANACILFNLMAINIDEIIVVAGKIDQVLTALFREMVKNTEVS